MLDSFVVCFLGISKDVGVSNVVVGFSKALLVFQKPHVGFSKMYVLVFQNVPT